MGDYTEIFFDQNEPLTIDDMSAISNNQQFLYEKIYQQAPRGVVLWHNETSNIACSTYDANTTITGFSFTWTPEINRLYLAQAYIPGIATSAGAGNQKVAISIVIGDKIASSKYTSYMGPSGTYQGIDIFALINSPLPEATTVTVKYLLSENTAPTVTLQGNANYQILFFIEDIGHSTTTMDYDNIVIGDGTYG